MKTGEPPQDLYLNMTDQKWKVPNRFWKLIVVFYDGKWYAAAFFISNDPWMSEVEEKQFNDMCVDKCDQYDSIVKQKGNHSEEYIRQHGLISCCSYAEFVQHVNFVSDVNLPLDTEFLSEAVLKKAQDEPHNTKLNEWPPIKPLRPVVPPVEPIVELPVDTPVDTPVELPTTSPTDPGTQQPVALPTIPTDQQSVDLPVELPASPVELPTKPIVLPLRPHKPHESAPPLPNKSDEQVIQVSDSASRSAQSESQIYSTDEADYADLSSNNTSAEERRQNEHAFYNQDPGNNYAHNDDQADNHSLPWSTQNRHDANDEYEDPNSYVVNKPSRAHHPHNHDSEHAVNDLYSKMSRSNRSSLDNASTDGHHTNSPNNPNKKRSQPSRFLRWLVKKSVDKAKRLLKPSKYGETARERRIRKAIEGGEKIPTYKGETARENRIRLAMDKEKQEQGRMKHRGWHLLRGDYRNDENQPPYSNRRPRSYSPSPQPRKHRENRHEREEKIFNPPQNPENRRHARSPNSRRNKHDRSSYRDDDRHHRPSERSQHKHHRSPNKGEDRNRHQPPPNVDRYSQPPHRDRDRDQPLEKHRHERTGNQEEKYRQPPDDNQGRRQRSITNENRRQRRDSADHRPNRR